MFTLDIYKNKVVLLVNTASYCGFTKQYDDMQELWDKYRDKGLSVLGIPSNSFNQEKKNNNDVKEYYVNGEIKDVDLRRILKKDKEKKPRWKSLFHLHKRWWIEIRDPLLNIHCLIDLGLFLGNKILEYKISGKFNKCRYGSSKYFCQWKRNGFNFYN